MISAITHKVMKQKPSELENNNLENSLIRNEVINREKKKEKMFASHKQGLSLAPPFT